MLLLAAALGDAPPAPPSAAAPPSTIDFGDDPIVTLCTFEPPSSLRAREPLPIRRSFEEHLVASVTEL